MIPQKLQIKNFLSYGPTLQTIDFLPYNLICLSGKNGHGKSALLDAITWALWGQARKISGTAKADQGLLRLGQTQMLVIFDFEFSGKSYRIRREYMETYGKPISILEFGMVDPQTDILIPLTDKTVRTTQEKIEQTLRLDFDSFSNSAFLRQGSSNEFSKKSPKDRKQILATILGIDQYEIIRKLALEKIKAIFAKKTVLMALQEKRQAELVTQEALNIQLNTLEQEMRSISEQEHQWNNNHNFYLLDLTSYNERQKQHHNLSFQIEQIANTIFTHKQKLREILSQWRTTNSKKHFLDNISQLKQEKNQIIATITQQQQLFQQNLEYKEKILNLAQQINSIEQCHREETTKKNNKLLLELERLLIEQKNQNQLILSKKEQIKQLLQEKIILSGQCIEQQKLLNSVIFNPDEVANAELHLEKRKAAYQNFVSLGNWINSELSNLFNKKKLVHEDDPSCPLCEQNLSASRRRFLKQNFEKQESFLSHRLQRLKHIIPILKEKLITEHAQLVQKKENVQKASTYTLKIEELTTLHTKISQQINDANHKVSLLNQEIDSLSQHINTQQHKITDQQNNNIPLNDSAYILLLQQKVAIEDTLKNNLYNEINYKQIQEKLKLIEHALTEHHAIHTELSQQDNRKKEINSLCVTIKQFKKTFTDIEYKKSMLGNLTEQLQLLKQKDQELNQEQITIKNNKEQLLHAKGSIENQHKQLTKIKIEFEQDQEHIIMLDATAEDYHSIATATGKDGIQALLIEDAIPEIEQEANHLLSRLTNNQAQIFIESLRDLKKGGTKETLDIKISDQIGIRPYEMFSGGEAFRIDFALRIAISKLLARRAGTALQTLIIDEGFGSQDEEGLGHIMDALHKIQDDFSKIIIVSHLPAMKDQFPVQFYIEKGVQGSTVSIIEQG